MPNTWVHYCLIQDHNAFFWFHNTLLEQTLCHGLRLTSCERETWLFGQEESSCHIPVNSYSYRWWGPVVQISPVLTDYLWLQTWCIFVQYGLCFHDSSRSWLFIFQNVTPMCCFDLWTLPSAFYFNMCSSAHLSVHIMIMELFWNPSWLQKKNTYALWFVKSIHHMVLKWQTDTQVDRTEYVHTYSNQSAHYA